MGNLNEDNNDTITLMHPCLHAGLIKYILKIFIFFYTKIMINFSHVG